MIHNLRQIFKDSHGKNSDFTCSNGLFEGDESTQCLGSIIFHKIGVDIKNKQDLMISSIDL